MHPKFARQLAERGQSDSIRHGNIEVPSDQLDQPMIQLPERSVSACLVSWKRQTNIHRIVAMLRQKAFIDDIIVWNNHPDRLEFSDTRVTVVQSPRNIIVYGRYCAIKYARHDTIYTQDDDCLVDNVDELYRSHLAAPHCISHALKPRHFARLQNQIHGTAQMSLVGWGAFFRKGAEQVLDTYLAHFGEDELLYREADRIFSLLLNRHHRSLLAKVQDLPGANGREALWMQPEHCRKNDESVSRALALLRR